MLSGIIPGFCIHLRQTVEGSKKRLITLGEMGTDQVIHILTEEATAWHCPYSNMFGQPFAVVEVVRQTLL